jgi:hypothetical protein
MEFFRNHSCMTRTSIMLFNTLPRPLTYRPCLRKSDPLRKRIRLSDILPSINVHPILIKMMPDMSATLIPHIPSSISRLHQELAEATPEVLVSPAVSQRLRGTRSSLWTAFPHCSVAVLPVFMSLPVVAAAELLLTMRECAPIG